MCLDLRRTIKYCSIVIPTYRSWPGRAGSEERSYSNPYASRPCPFRLEAQYVRDAGPIAEMKYRRREFFYFQSTGNASSCSYSSRNIGWAWYCAAISHTWLVYDWSQRLPRSDATPLGAISHKACSMIKVLGPPRSSPPSNYESGAFDGVPDTIGLESGTGGNHLL